MIGIITKRDVIQSVPERYKRQYEDSFGKMRLADGSDPYDTYLALRKLNTATISPLVIDEIMGNDSWTELKCDHCGKSVGRIVRLEGDYEQMGLCCDCIDEAADALKAKEPS